MFSNFSYFSFSSSCSNGLEDGKYCWIAKNTFSSLNSPDKRTDRQINVKFEIVIYKDTQSPLAATQSAAHSRARAMRAFSYLYEKNSISRAYRWM